MNEIFAKIPSNLTEIKLHILVGQSNAEGRLLVTDLKDDSNFQWAVHDNLIPNTFTYCPEWSSTSRVEVKDNGVLQPYILGFNQVNGLDSYSTYCGLDMYLSKLYADYNDEPFFLLKLALSGWPLNSLTSSINLKLLKYIGNISDIAQSNGINLNVKDVILWQGEYEAQTLVSEVDYKASLDSFVSFFENKVRTDIIFIDVNLSDNQTGVNATGIANIQAAKTSKAAESSRYHLINTDDISDYPDTIHAGATGLRTVAERINLIIRDL